MKKSAHTNRIVKNPLDCRHRFVCRDKMRWWRLHRNNIFSFSFSFLFGVSFSSFFSQCLFCRLTNSRVSLRDKNAWLLNKHARMTRTSPRQNERNDEESAREHWNAVGNERKEGKNCTLKRKCDSGYAQSSHAKILWMFSQGKRF